MEPIVYGDMNTGQEECVCALVRRVFNDLVAPDYEAHGIEEFFRFANPAAMKARVSAGGFVLVASMSGGIVGMLEFAPPDRIAMLFVSRRNRGIARALLERAIRHVLAADPTVSKLTVHSSPYARPFYEKMGFKQVTDVTTKHGITYIPMERGLQSTGKTEQA